MKTFFFKLLIVACLIGGTFIESQAQTPFSKESHVLHGGFGLGGWTDDVDGFGVNSSPIISVSYDQGLIDNLGIGNLGIGGAFGIKRYEFDNSDGSWSRAFLGARGTYHFDFVNSDKLDFYAGVNAGFLFHTNSTDNVESEVIPYVGPIAGINYWLTSFFGLYAEAGYGLGYINGGVALNF